MSVIKTLSVPDIGDFTAVAIIEVLVAVGDVVHLDDALITLESDKAAMEIPATLSGQVTELLVKVGDKVSEGHPILTLEIAETAETAELIAQEKAQVALPASFAPVASVSAPAILHTPPAPEPVAKAPPAAALTPAKNESQTLPHASPSVRRVARELGVDLSLVQGTGRKNRIGKNDVQAFVKQSLKSAQPASNNDFALPDMPHIDFAQFGDIETQPLSRIQKISSNTLHRNWLAAPHVTQFDEADITDLEAFRQGLADEAEQRGVKMTLIAFLMKAVVAGLKKYPQFNASLGIDKETLILKKYFHIGCAVDTPQGLVVPVIRDADKKGLFDIAAELGQLSTKAREGKLSPNDMQGGCFTISSLGGIGGTLFTPILNSPEVGILGISRAKMQPVYQQGEFVPRLLLPLSLSYDHRVIDGALGARFTTYMKFILSDVRRLLI
jgi:pyruvate dehydrogenase E2 component (dihydrolipoamide acetyltransferase)